MNMWMDQVDILHVGRYWSEVLCCTITTHLDDLEVKVTRSRSQTWKFSIGKTGCAMFENNNKTKPRCLH